MKLLLTVAMLVALAFGGGAVALEAGDKVGPVLINPGSVICDAVEEVEQAIDTSTPFPAGCGTLVEASLAYIEALSEHQFGDAEFILLKIIFIPLMHSRIQLGVQYGWEYHPLAPDLINGEKA